MTFQQYMKDDADDKTIARRRKIYIKYALREFNQTPGKYVANQNTDSDDVFIYQCVYPYSRRTAIYRLAYRFDDILNAPCIPKIAGVLLNRHERNQMKEDCAWYCRRHEIGEDAVHVYNRIVGEIGTMEYMQHIIFNKWVGTPRNKVDQEVMTVLY